MEEHDYQSVVVDSADWLERLIWDKLCEIYGVDSIEKVDGGYSRGYTHALTYWRHIIDGLETLRLKRNMCVIVLAHAKVELSPTRKIPRMTATRRGCKARQTLCCANGWTRFCSQRERLSPRARMRASIINAASRRDSA
jgi:hypothetical protein